MTPTTDRPWAMGLVTSLEPLEFRLIAVVPTEEDAESLCREPMHFIGPMEDASPDALRIVWDKVRYPKAGRVM